MNIRPATQVDIPQMIAIERASDMAAHWGEGHYTTMFEGESPARLALVAELSEQDVLLRSHYNRVCGFIVARELGSEWEIENVVVEREVRRNGIGTQLLEAVIEQARAAGCSRLVLEVRQSNEPARKLYKNKGFSDSGPRPKYYENPTEDAILLHLEFSNPTLEKA